MKSIMEEASSVSKAVEQAWRRAGKPQEFKVKIFEEPQKNLIGFTTKPAKIAFFFEEQHVVEGRPQQPMQKKYSHAQHQATQDSRQDRSAQSDTRPQRDVRPIQDKQAQPQQQRRQPYPDQRAPAPKYDDKNKQPKAQPGTLDTQQQLSIDSRPAQNQPKPRQLAVWSDDIIAYAQTWIKQVLQLMGLPNITFSTTVTNNLLHVQFSTPVLENESKERMLFSSFAHILMLTLRHTCKRQLGNLKVVFKSGSIRLTT